MTSSIVPISMERHAGKTFRRFASYGFAGTETVAPLVAAELAKATVSFPIAFLKQGEDVLLVGMMGLEPGSNLFVAPDGKWIGAYIPAAFRAHPFVLARAQDDRQVLCINEASGLVVDDPAGERFFAEDGKPSPAIQSILDFLTSIHANRVLTERACQAIARHDLLEPWTIVAPGETGPRNVSGLWRISEAKLGQLSDEAFVDLRRSGAIVLAYGQLMSMGHLPMLERLAGLKAQIRQQSKAPLPDNLDSIFGMAGSSQEIEIDWSQFKP